MTPHPQPVIALGDTLTLTAILLGARYLLLVLAGSRGWAKWIALWLRRIMIAAVLLPVARLAEIAVARPAIAGILAGVAVAILAAGALALVLDRWVGGMIERWRKASAQH